LGLARQEAQRFSHDYIGTEHILLGLIQEDSGVASDVMKNLDLDRKTIRRKVEALVTPGTMMVTRGQLPFTPRAKIVLELAYEEATNLGHNYIGTEHLLLGLIREQEGIAAQVLQNIKVRLEDVREEVLELLGAEVGEREEKNAEPVRSRTFHHLGVHKDRMAAEAHDTLLTVLAEMHYGRAEEGERPDVLLTLAPHLRMEWMFHLGAAAALEIPVILLLRPGETAEPLLERWTIQVAIDGAFEANLRAALEH
jgi:ATP-dependent Clp protease ATP-binding subunit ClpA